MQLATALLVIPVPGDRLEVRRYRLDHAVTRRRHGVPVVRRLGQVDDREGAIALVARPRPGVICVKQAGPPADAGADRAWLGDVRIAPKDRLSVVAFRVPERHYGDRVVRSDLARAGDERLIAPRGRRRPWRGRGNGRGGR